jgi:hypothetical protein
MRLKLDEAYTALASAFEPTEIQDRPFYFAIYCWFVSAIACKSGRTELSLCVNLRLGFECAKSPASADALRKSVSHILDF